MPGAECLRLKRRKGEGRADAHGSGDVDIGVFPANARTRWRQARLGATKTLAVADADAKNFRDAPLPGPTMGTRAGLGAAAYCPIATSFGLALAVMEPLSDLTVSGT